MSRFDYLAGNKNKELSPLPPPSFQTQLQKLYGELEKNLPLDERLQRDKTRRVQTGLAEIFNSSRENIVFIGSPRRPKKERRKSRKNKAA